ncbi:flavodoxin family protein [uncultured Algoriphagus sp.]|uniref:flavodoxin family protein n=1 Tax=uncultured Algoriphagus sp. TaxID=417365 RepID=UPI0030EDC4BC|tara:strand:+ start:1643 stop:2368 length:726 start_codon:yes stop_codon:yes gene_type:complete
MNKPNFAGLKAIVINCTIKKSPQKSHTEKLIHLAKGIMERENVRLDELRLVDYTVPPGNSPDMTKEGWEKDDWPDLFERIITSDIVIMAGPIWLGELSSVAKVLIERLDAMSTKTNSKGQYIYYGKTGSCLITGNEDGLKHCAMGILFSLQHLGFTIPPQADCGWIGEVGPGPSYGDTEWKGKQIDPPMGFDSEFTHRNVTFMVYNLLHVANILRELGGFPSYGNSVGQWEAGERWEFKSH